MSSVLFKGNKTLQNHTLKTFILSAVALLAGGWLLTQLPPILPWTNTTAGAAFFPWLFKVCCIAAGVTVVIAAVQAFFSYVREEFDLGPTPICTFFMIGVILALLNTF
ncbi:hypothetical protein [Leptothoe kymatousa]|uniref:Uncharacterized protein n=1 Tax=Leptothoe kymatousa TAU-MAC 1615 TaxID=2364775 RepID=A0ABS5Y715_9CYAN|nr:hypothetical protein [Leptothoe kymatousa]MBT9313659.1 hypothetical protein [Leptothoe kymatousa TAU-MAC 1615]